MGKVRTSKNERLRHALGGANITSKRLLSSDSLDSLEELGTALKKIYLRMSREGYTINEGKIVKL